MPFSEETVEGINLPSTVTLTIYTYGDSSWGDLLTAYNDVARTYDEIGNVLTDGTWTYTWQNSRELAAMTDGTTTWNYTYDANGMRTSRTNGTKTYNYVYNGSQLTQMTVGNDTLSFTYGLLGPATVTWNGTTYYYSLSGQGDVNGIFNEDGNPVVTYNWDNAWGYNPIPEGVMASTLGELNPLRYRSYVYDNETGYYYLQSRYYDPQIGRFINADVFAASGQGLTGNNMFAYCGNNPVVRGDANGEAWNWLIGAIIGGVVGGISAAVTGGNATDIIIGIAAGAVAGGIIAGTGNTTAGRLAGSAVNALGTGIDAKINGASYAAAGLAATASFAVTYGASTLSAFVGGDVVASTVCDCTFGFSAGLVSAASGALAAKVSSQSSLKTTTQAGVLKNNKNGSVSINSYDDKKIRCLLEVKLM